jgi:hypothetical protein
MRILVLLAVLGLGCGAGTATRGGAERAATPPGRDPAEATPEPTVASATEAATAPPSAPASPLDRVRVKLVQGVSTEELLEGELPAPLLQVRPTAAGWLLLEFVATDPPRDAQAQAALVEALQALPTVATAEPEGRQLRR